MDKIWNYKNFNMVYELDVAGEFIYDGIQALNQMNSISIGAPIFSFLYHLSVGIERLQKIILVLFEDITLENYEEFEKSLITHSHGYLHERISKKVNVDFNSRENEFLTLLSTFYNHSRYNRFNFNASLNQEKELLEEYILKYINDYFLYYSMNEYLQFDLSIKKWYNINNKVIGVILCVSQYVMIIY